MWWHGLLLSLLLAGGAGAQVWAGQWLDQQPGSQQNQLHAAKNVTAKVMGGITADAEIWPWIVSIGRERDARFYDAHQTQFCGGTLIAGQWVMTAAHCVDDLQADELAVHIGENDLGQAAWEDRLLVSQIAIHPEFNAITLDHDIALLKLQQNVLWPAAPLASLDNTSYAAISEPLIVLGWGDVRPGPETFYPRQLQQAELMPVPRGLCVLDYPGSVTNNMLCAIAANTDACRGDSGGPLLAMQNGELQQVGLVSWGPICGQGSTPGVYTRLHDEHTRWINDVMQGRSVFTDTASGNPLLGSVGGSGALGKWEFAGLLSLLLGCLIHRLRARI